jgi:hypothetical protein
VIRSAREIRGNHFANRSSRWRLPCSQTPRINAAVNVFVMLYARNAGSCSDCGVQRTSVDAPVLGMTATLATPRPRVAALSKSSSGIGSPRIGCTRERRHEAGGNDDGQNATHDQPRRAASIVAMSIFLISIIASNARFAAAGSGSVIACVSTIGVICQDTPHLSLHHPHALS